MAAPHTVPSPTHPRHLVVILGDQLDPASAAFDGFQPETDVVWMAEAQEESTHVWSHLARSALFLAAMRHFRDAQRAQGRSVLYRKLEAPGHTGTLAGELKAAVRSLRPQKLIMVEPGEWRVAEALRQAARACGGLITPVFNRALEPKAAGSPAGATPGCLHGYRAWRRSRSRQACSR